MLGPVREFFRLIIGQKFFIYSMVRRTLFAKYAGSWLGLFWTIIHPMVMILILWFLFGIGFKARPMHGVPFVVWLTAGMAVWNGFDEIVRGSTGSLLANAPLITKTGVQPHMFPIVHLLSSIVTHGIFLVLLLVLMVIHGVPLDWYAFQFVYYYMAMLILALSVGWFTSVVNVFVRDTEQIVNVLLQVFFWVTPVFWEVSIMPERFRFLIKLNPLFYLVQGYRESFLAQVPFWAHPQLTAYYWCVTGLTLITSVMVFRKAKLHFADVL